jgi:hypothetical protein
MREIPEIAVRALIVLGLLALAVAQARADDMYRWVDAQGEIHFGADPPKGARNVRRVDGSGARSINVVPGTPVAPPREAPRVAPPEDAAPVGTVQGLVPGEGALHPSASTAIGGRSEDDWRTEAQRLTRKVESLEAQLERADDQRRSAISPRDSSYYERKVARLEQELEAAQSALDRFEERARKLEVPPGWLR